MTWAKVKDFLRKNLRNNWTFVNSICSKFRQDIQYQAKSVLDWTAHLEYLQSILLEYDTVGALTKLTMLRYFRENLKPLILAELEHQDLELKSFNQMVKKTVDAKVKVALWPRSSTRKIDHNCPCGNQPANSTVIKGQNSTIKNSRVEKPKTRGPKSSSGSQHFNESSEKAQKEKKKEQR